jgi:hypothetical protein
LSGTSRSLQQQQQPWDEHSSFSSSPARLAWYRACHRRRPSCQPPSRLRPTPPIGLPNPLCRRPHKTASSRVPRRYSSTIPPCEVRCACLRTLRVLRLRD